MRNTFPTESLAAAMDELMKTFEDRQEEDRDEEPADVVRKDHTTLCQNFPLFLLSFRLGCLLCTLVQYTESRTMPVTMAT